MQVKAVAQLQTKKSEVAQRREVFAGLFAAAAMAVVAQPAQAEERSSTLIAKLCASNPTCESTTPHFSFSFRVRQALLRGDTLVPKARKL